MRYLSLKVVGTAFLAAACNFDSSPDSESEYVERRVVSESVRVRDPAERELLKNELAAAGIDFVEVDRDDGTYVQWGGADSERVRGIRERVFGPDLPNGRNVAYTQDLEYLQQEFKDWLAERGIPYKTAMQGDVEFIYWEAEDDGRVREWPHLSNDP
jgi:hypothetical protein